MLRRIIRLLWTMKRLKFMGQGNQIVCMTITIQCSSWEYIQVEQNVGGSLLDSLPLWTSRGIVMETRHVPQSHTWDTAVEMLNRAKCLLRHPWSVRYLVLFNSLQIVHELINKHFFSSYELFCSSADAKETNAFLIVSSTTFAKREV